MDTTSYLDRDYVLDAPIQVDIYKVQSVARALLVLKTLEPLDKRRIVAAPTNRRARGIHKLAIKVGERPYSRRVLLEMTRAKFLNNRTLARRLLDTGHGLIDHEDGPMLEAVRFFIKEQESSLWYKDE